MTLIQVISVLRRTCMFGVALPSKLAPILSIAAGLMLEPTTTLAQGNTPDLQSPGFPADTLHLGSQVDDVQIDNGNLHIEIPISSFKGRSAYTYHDAIVYDSKGWFGNQINCVPTVHNCFVQVLKSSPIALSEQSGPGYSLVATEMLTNCQNNSTTVDYFTNFYLLESDGTRHPFPLTVWAGGIAENQIPLGCIILQESGYAADGSGWYLDYTNDPSKQNIPSCIVRMVE